jgi:hypothetical protein
MTGAQDIDEDTRALVEQLCTRAGTLMEDTSVEALVRAASLDDLYSKIVRSKSAVGRMERLLRAADALLQDEGNF